MGVILDSSVLIAGERRRDTVWKVLERIEVACGKTSAALSAVTAEELTHSIYRAKTDADRKRRETFVDSFIEWIRTGNFASRSGLSLRLVSTYPRE